MSAVQSVVQDLVKKPNSISVVWTHFGFEPDRDGKPVNEELAVCRLCYRKVCTRGSNTSNLFSHLRTAHAKEYSPIKDGRKPRKTKNMEGGEGSGQPSIPQSFARSEKYSRSSKRRTEVSALGSVHYYEIFSCNIIFKSDNISSVKFQYRPTLYYISSVQRDQILCKMLVSRKSQEGRCRWTGELL